MSNRVIICEASEIITAGLYDIIQSIADFDVVMRLDSPENLSEKLLVSDANILIINPSLLGFNIQSQISQWTKENHNLYNEDNANYTRTSFIVNYPLIGTQNSVVSKSYFHE